MSSNRSVKQALLANPPNVPKDEERFHQAKKELSVTMQNKHI